MKWNKHNSSIIVDALGSGAQISKQGNIESHKFINMKTFSSLDACFTAIFQRKFCLSALKWKLINITFNEFHLQFSIFCSSLKISQYRRCVLNFKKIIKFDFYSKLFISMNSSLTISVVRIYLQTFSSPRSLENSFSIDWDFLQRVSANTRDKFERNPCLNFLIRRIRKH